MEQETPMARHPIGGAAVAYTLDDSAGDSSPAEHGSGAILERMEHHAHATWLRCVPPYH